MVAIESKNIVFWSWPYYLAAYLIMMICSDGILVTEPPIIYFHIFLAIALGAIAVMRLFSQGVPTGLAFGASWIAFA